MYFSLSPKVFVLAGAVVLAAFMGPARADQTSAGSVALAAQMIEVVGLKNSVDGIGPLTLNELIQNIARLHPEMLTSLKESAVKIAPEFAKSDATVLGDLAHVLASKMTDAEMRDTLAFFQGPVGKKYLATQPVLLQEFNVATGIWRRDLQNQLLNRLREDMKTKGFEF